MISLENVKKRYRNKEVLSSTCLELFTGSENVVAILGNNGAGKSTILNIISGRLKPSNGVVKIDGVHINSNRRLYLDKIGALLDPNFLYSDLTGLQNLKLLTYRNWGNYVHIFQLEELLNRKVSTFSLGQRQKLNLCLCFINSNEYLILDEPTSNLDKHTTQILIDVIKDSDKKIIFTSHDKFFTSQVCDKVYEINNHQIFPIDPKKLENMYRVILDKEISLSKFNKNTYYELDRKKLNELFIDLENNSLNGQKYAISIKPEVKNNEF